MTEKEKEKAKELVRQYKLKIKESDINALIEFVPQKFNKMLGELAKECALIDVNNTIEALYEADIDSNRKTIDFYKQVKQHLEEM